MHGSQTARLSEMPARPILPRFSLSLILFFPVKYRKYGYFADKENKLQVPKYV